jgi:hypothetical protein
MNTEQETKRVHHPYSPSKLQCLEACPCYESTNNENEASATGTKQHGVVESGIDDASLPDYKALAQWSIEFRTNIKYPGCTVCARNTAHRRREIQV